MKDIFKEKILVFIIGLLLGAVIATGAFVVCTKTCHSNGHRQEVMQLPGGNNNQNNQNNQPPSMPNGNNNNQNNQNNQPPEMPSDNNSQPDNTQANNN